MPLRSRESTDRARLNPADISDSCATSIAECSCRPCSLLSIGKSLHNYDRPETDQSSSGEHRVPIIGFSATFSRPDQLALSAVFEKIVFHREVTAMLDEGWSVPRCLKLKRG